MFLLGVTTLFEMFLTQNVLHYLHRREHKTPGGIKANRLGIGMLDFAKQAIIADESEVGVPRADQSGRREA